MTRPHFRQWEAVTFAGEGKPAQRQTVTLYYSPLTGDSFGTVDGQTMTAEEARAVLEAADSVTKVFEKLTRTEEGQGAA